MSGGAATLGPAEWRDLVRQANLFFTVVSDSMRPSFRKGDEVLLVPFDAPPRPGQVLAYFRHADQMLVTHRYHGQGRFRGDNALAFDPPVADADIVALVAKVRRGGLEFPVPPRTPLPAQLRRLRKWLTARWTAQKLRHG